MLTGWQTIGGKNYCFGDDGGMLTGWQQLDGVPCYLPDGVLATGWQEIDGKRYYFGDDGKMRTGFTNIGGDIYYLDEGGQPLTGDAFIGENRYHFSDEGVMHTGWLTSEDGLRYYQADGTMATAWQEIGGKRYYFGENGAATIGWYQEGEYNYYFLSDGSAAVGPTEIDGETHFFTPKGMEVILVNAAHPIPSYYTVNPVIVVDWHRVDQRCYEPLMQMLSDCSGAGIEYIFNCGYRTMQEQTDILEKRTQEHMKEFDLDFDEARKRRWKPWLSPAPVSIRLVWPWTLWERRPTPGWGSIAGSTASFSATPRKKRRSPASPTSRGTSGTWAGKSPWT